MKKTLLVLTLITASIDSVFACSGSSCFAPTISGNAAVNGAISNSINASATVGSGVGTSFSSAWSGALSAANASVAGSGTTTFIEGVLPSNSSITSIDATGVINGSTTTDVYGGAYNTSTGMGTGFANATGWSDAGSSAKFNAILPNYSGSVTTSGVVDTGHTNHVGFGPDISVHAGSNNAIMAEGQAGGVFKSEVNVNITNLNNTVSGSISDVKSTSDYAATFLTPITGAAAGTTMGSYTMDSGSNSNVNAAGSFLVNSTISNSVPR